MLTSKVQAMNCNCCLKLLNRNLLPSASCTCQMSAKTWIISRKLLSLVETGQLETIFLSANGFLLEIQMQGNTNKCGLCALNNSILGTFVSPETLNYVADLTWLQQALNLDISIQLEKQISTLGDYNFDSMQIAAQRSGFACRRLIISWRHFSIVQTQLILLIILKIYTNR